MEHGGNRIGAGRKKGFVAKNDEEVRKYLSERVAEEIGPIGEDIQGFFGLPVICIGMTLDPKRQRVSLCPAFC